VAYINGISSAYQSLNPVTDNISETVITENIQGAVIRIWDTDEGGIRVSEVKIYGVQPGTAQSSPTQANTSAVLTANNGITGVRPVSNNTTTLSIEEQIDQAISRKDYALLAGLLSNNPGSFTQQHVDNAFVNGQTEQGKKIAASTGIKPSSAAISSMMLSGKSSVIQDLLNNGIADANTAMLNDALKSNQGSLVNYLSKRVKPNSETFVLLANDGNSDLFEEIVDNDNRVPDNKAINIAIDKGNIVIVNAGLNNGGNANEALGYAMGKNNTDMVKLIVTRKGVDPSKAFKYAVNNNDESLYSSLLAIPGSDAKTALDEAMKAKKYDMAMLALETKRTAPTKYLKTAVETGNTLLAKKIVEVGGDPNEGMELAIEKNNFELVDYFVSNGAAATNPKYLQNAAVACSMDMIKLLVQAGAAPNNGMANAALNNREDVIVFLLDKGADANLGMSPAAHAGSVEIIKSLVAKGADPTKGMESAAAQNKVDVLAYLIENGADVSSPKLVPLAVTKNYTEAFKLLVEKGAVINGANLLQVAAANGNTDIAGILVEHQYNPDEGMPVAIQKNRAAVVQLLIEKGAVIKDNYAADAVSYKAAAVIPVLAFAGADFKKSDGLGNTFLHIAATANDAASVEELIKAGVPLDAQNVKGNTALHIAADMTDRVPIIMLLAKAGANLNIKNNKGDTPRDVAPGLSKTKKALKELGAQ